MNGELAKIELERSILKRAHSLLLRLYGNYAVDECQKDRPDAAIDVERPHKRFGRERKPIKVGIEITTIDSKKYLAYFNDKKFGQDLVDAQFNASLQNRVDPEKLNKYMKVEIPSDYIYNGVKGKSLKHEEYKAHGIYSEIVLLCYTDLLECSSPFLKEGLIEWTNYYASKDGFPFDKILFLAKGSDSAVKIYDRRTPLRKEPPPYDFVDPWIMPSEWPMLLFDRNYNFNDFYSRPPLITPKKFKKKGA